MKRALTTALLTLFFFSCLGEASQKDEGIEIIKQILRPLELNRIEVVSVERVNSPQIPGFTTYLVTLKDKTKRVLVKKYAWISKDKKLLTFEIIEVEKTKKGGKERYSFHPLKPKKPVKSLPPEKEDVSEILDSLNILKGSGYPCSIGKGDKKLLVIWDVFCPFCFREIKEILKEKPKAEVFLLPFPVHGKNSIKGYAYFLELSKEKGVKNALKEITSYGKDFRTYRENFGKILKDKKINQKAEKVVLKVREKLLKSGIRAVPTLVYVPEGEKNKGYIFVGLRSDIKKILSTR
jgi:thiol:disulfide interchange protein DsbC